MQILKGLCFSCLKWLEIMFLLTSMKGTAGKTLSKDACSLNTGTHLRQILNYSRNGNLILGCIFQLSLTNSEDIFEYRKNPFALSCFMFYVQYLRHLLAFAFAIEEINNSTVLLPNITLGFLMYDSCHSESLSVLNTLRILSVNKDPVPNYSCSQKDRVVAFIGHLMSSPSYSSAGITGIYRYPQIPHSVCSESCPPGYRKASQNGKPICCFDCVPCPEGEVANKTDMENCEPCPEDQWSNQERSRCIPRTIDSLSYEEPLGVALTSAVLFFCIITAGVMGIFMKHQNTPLVRANNQGLSYTLLLSLLLSFLCSLLFIGRPLQLTCLLRQPAFGIIFTVAVSSVLAKTLTVSMAFNATRPDSRLKKWLKMRVSIYLICLCSLGEVLICIIWILSSPPFLEADTKTEIGKIILKCNEGSDIFFYAVIGYMGCLALISFIVAFKVRKLPDNFNEAQFITFSMLVFCSVWVSFIPAYLSTKGKYMVAVEVFAILVSSAGLLGSIFIPKCYIILLKPELNTREQLVAKHTG